MQENVGGRKECPDCKNYFLDVKKHTRHSSNDCGNRGEEKEENQGKSTYQKRKETYGENWQEAREKVLERDGYECRGCGMTHEEHKQDDSLFPPDKGLHVHHKIKASTFDTPKEANKINNLVSLCYDCHQTAENDVLTLSIL